jgi:hypothetical protein
VTHRLDSREETGIEGEFYVPRGAEMMTGFALKAARIGRPGDLVVTLGTERGKGDLVSTRLRGADVLPQYDLWYDTKLEKALRLAGGRLYFFRLSVEPRGAPDDYYLLYGPRPLGGQDFPRRFGLAFRVLTEAVPMSGVSRSSR